MDFIGGPLFFTGCNDKIEPGNTDFGPPASIKAAVVVATLSNQPFVYEALGTIIAQTASTLSGKILARSWDPTT
jgi:hypothetical protein